MFFLAYGMIEFPRSLWNKSDLNYCLLAAQMKATNDYQEIADNKIRYTHNKYNATSTNATMSLPQHSGTDIQSQILQGSNRSQLHGQLAESRHPSA